MEVLNRKFSTTVSGIIGIAIFLIVTSAWIFSDDIPQAGLSVFKPIAQVKQGPFDVFITEQARLDARRSVTLSSALPSNKANILYLVPEGTYIRQGEVVARFDTTTFEEKIQNVENDIKEESTNLAQVEAEQSLQEADSKDQAAKLKHQIELAKLQLASLRDGDIPIRLAQSQRELDKTEADFNRAHKIRNTEDALFAKGLSKAKSRQDAIDIEQQKKATYQIARQNLQTQRDVTLPAELKQAELELENKKAALNFFANTLTHKKKKREASIARAHNKLNMLAQDLDRARQHLENTTIYAPVNGIVIYKILTIQREKRKVQVGDSLWNRHAFAVIPDMSSMMAIVEVREQELSKLEVGQSVSVYPQAYTDLLMEGTVESIGTLASDDKQSNKSKLFSVRIALDNTDSRLRPGMTARASILTSRFASATLVPVEAIFYEDRQPVCFLWRGGAPLRVPVELGKSDGQQVVIHAGLEASQEVMLVYPSSFDS